MDPMKLALIHLMLWMGKSAGSVCYNTVMKSLPLAN
jgi:hypothetical protein